MIKKEKGCTLSEILEYISSSKEPLIPDAAGGTNSVYYIKCPYKKKERPHTVLLKRTDSPVCAFSFTSAFNIKRNRCKKLQEKGVQVALPTEGYYSSFEKAFYETQNLAHGQSVNIRSPMTAATMFLKRNFLEHPGDSLDCLNLTVKEKAKVVNEVVTYHSVMFNKLMHSSDKHLIRFLSDFKTIIRSDLYIDTKSENFFYDEKKGFTFIDVGEDTYPSFLENITDREIYEQFKEIFSLPPKLKDDMNERQTYLLTQKSAEIINRTDSLAQNAGYDFSVAPVQS